MGIFDVFKKKKPALTTEEKLNRMWELWAIGDLKGPCAELMTYQSEVNNGGHDQFFFNTSNVGDLAGTVAVLLDCLPDPLRENLDAGYNWYRAHEEDDSEEHMAFMERCDTVFYENEEKINRLLEAYAGRISL